ncbi:MAG: pentapeptide repeat-containing protein [Polyangiaceae bacterium]|nr:pentapeptide repeat-containing protein [Polyangiaceae bacterium]
MPEMTPDVVLKKIKTGEKVERADLRGLPLPQASLEGASFRRCDLDGANFEGARLARAVFKNASLREAFFSGADLREANLESADLEGANMQGAKLVGANLHRANLEGANLQGADLSGARLTHAQLELAKLGGARLVGAQLAHASLIEADLSTTRLDDADLTNTDLTRANLEESSLPRALLRDAQLSGATLTRADLSNADLRRAILTGAHLELAQVSGAKVHGLVGPGFVPEGLRGEWVDASVEADGVQRTTGAALDAVFSGRRTTIVPPAPAAHKRYFGKGDVLRNAHLEFDAGAAVEIESLFEHCTISLGERTELVIGRGGVLSGCQIHGAGRITIHGKFVEHEAPGIVGATQLVVSAHGSLVAAIEQPLESTRFGFEPGCMLRVKIQPCKTERPTTSGRPR